MNYPLIVDGDGEVILIRDAAELSCLEPIDIENGVYRFWDAEGFRMKATGAACRETPLCGLFPQMTTIDQQDAAVEFSREESSRADASGLKSLLRDRGVLMDEAARALVQRILASQSGDLARGADSAGGLECREGAADGSCDEKGNMVKCLT